MDNPVTPTGPTPAIPAIPVLPPTIAELQLKAVLQQDARTHIGRMFATPVIRK